MQLAGKGVTLPDTASGDEATEEPERTHEKLSSTSRGMVLVAGSALAFSIMSMLVQVIARQGVPSFQIVFVNASIRCLLCVAQMFRVSRWPELSRRIIGLVMLRAIGGFGGITCAFYAFSVLPLGDATVVLFTSPVWTTLLAAAVLGEPIGLVEVSSITLSLAGVIMVAHIAEANFTPQRIVGSMIALAGAMSAAVAYCSVKLLKGSVEPVLLVLVFSALSLLFSPVGMYAFGQSWSDLHGVEIWILIGCMGVAGYVGQLMLNTGLQMGNSLSRTTLARNLDIVFAFVLQVLVMKDVIYISSVIGAVLIALCSVLTFVKSWKDECASQENELAIAPAKYDECVQAESLDEDSHLSEQCEAELGSVTVELVN